MKSFLSALQFLTTLPVRTKYLDEKNLGKATIYFPLIGLCLGLILVGTNNLLTFLNFSPFTINVILIVLLIILTGGLHLDGLADTLDALMSRKSKEEMLKIMRESTIGTMGVLAIMSILLLKISFLYSISAALKTVSLLLICILSRWSLVLSIFLFPYAREEGKAKIFFQKINFRIFALSTLITIGCVIYIWKLKGLLIMGIVALISYIIGKFIKHKIGGLTGDSLGAVNEIAEFIILVSIYLLERSGLWII